MLLRQRAQIQIWGNTRAFRDTCLPYYFYRLWTDKEFKKGGHDIQVKDIDLIPEYSQITISIKRASQDHVREGLQRAFERMMTGEVLEELPDLLPCV